MEEDPVPPYEPAQSGNKNTFAFPALQTSLEESMNMEQAQLLTPASATMSIPSSKAISATSSNLDAPAHGGRSTVTTRRSQNYHGLYTQPVSSSRPRRPLPCRTPSPARCYSPPSCRSSPPRHLSSQHCSPPNRYYMHRSPSLDHRPIRCCSLTLPNNALDTLQGRNRPVMPEVRIIQTQELHRIVQDMDTGISALVLVMQVSSSQMGLDLSALMRPTIPESHQERLSTARHTPRSIEGS